MKRLATTVLVIVVVAVTVCIASITTEIALAITGGVVSVLERFTEVALVESAVAETSVVVCRGSLVGT